MIAGKLTSTHSFENDGENWYYLDSDKSNNIFYWIIKVLDKGKYFLNTVSDDDDEDDVSFNLFPHTTNFQQTLKIIKLLHKVENVVAKAKMTQLQTIKATNWLLSHNDCYFIGGKQMTCVTLENVRKNVHLALA